MERFENLLYVERRLPGSERGFARALDLAARNGALLTVAAVVEPEPPPRGAGPWVPGTAQRRHALVERWRRLLQERAGAAQRRGVPAAVRLLRDADGECGQAICAAVERGGHDLVISVTEPGHLPLPWGHAGDRYLLRHCPCPVWLIHPAQGGDIRVVVAAVDVGAGRPTSLPRKILAMGGSLARNAGASFHVVHAWSVLGESLLADPLRGVSPERMRGLLDTMRAGRRDEVRRLVEAVVPGAPVDIAVRKGDPVRIVREEAHRLEADVVVVGTAARRGLEALVFPNVAERLVGRVPASVLVVKEDPRSGVGTGTSRERPREHQCAAGEGGR